MSWSELDNVSQGLRGRIETIVQNTKADLLDGLWSIVDDLTFALRHIGDLCVYGHTAVTADRPSFPKLLKTG